MCSNSLSLRGLISRSSMTMRSGISLSNLLHAVLVELFQKSGGILEVSLGFPCVVFVGVSLPFDEVSLTSLFQDLFGLELVFLLGFEMERRLQRGI